MFFRAGVALFALCLRSSGNQDISTVSRTSVSASIPLSAPPSSSTLARNLISFSIEGDRWPEWSTSTLFHNALNNLAKITGRQPDVRVGANSEDHTVYNDTVNTIQATFPASTPTTPYPEASIILANSSYYALSKNLPSGTHMIWGVNFGTGDVNNAVAQTQAIMVAFAPGSPVSNDGIILDFIEVGNEADLYASHGLRNVSYDINQYTGQWQVYATAVASAAGMQPGSSPGLLLASFAESDHDAGGFSPQMMFRQGVLSSPLGQYITTISQHHYSGSFCHGNGGLLANLMNKSGIRSNISSFDPDISASIDNGLTYIFGETNSYSCHGAPGVANTAGAAIWALDYALQAATHDIRRIYFHEGVGFKYNLIQPVTLSRSILNNRVLSPPLAPHVQPQYYAAIVVAVFIGNSKSNTISTQISELSISDSRIAGYAAYDNGQLARAVLINSKAYLTTTTTARGSVLVNTIVLVGGASPSPAMMRVERLVIGHADDGHTLTFGGQSYETSDGLVSGMQVYSDVPVARGVSVKDTEAVLLTFLY